MTNALVTLEDMDAALNMYTEDNTYEDDEELNGEVHLLYDVGVNKEEYGEALVCWNDTQTAVDCEIEQGWANNAFLHGSSYIQDKEEAMHVMNCQLTSDDYKLFTGIHHDTCANRTSVIYRYQYLSYCSEFGLKPSIRNAKGGRVKFVAGISKGIGVVRLQIPFADLDMIIDVYFLVLNGDVPTLMSGKHTISRGLDISLIIRYVSHGNRKQALTLENYFPTHRWTRKDLHNVVYTQLELRTFHRFLGHTSIRATKNLLKRVDREERMDTETRNCVQRYKPTVWFAYKSQRPRGVPN